MHAQRKVLMHSIFLVSIYQPPFAGHNKVDPPLPPKGSLTVGYGSGGEVPRIFKLGKNQNVEVGFLKLFLSTEYVDLSDIEQLTPFEWIKEKGVITAEPPKKLLWDTILATCVLRKK